MRRRVAAAGPADIRVERADLDNRARDAGRRLGLGLTQTARFAFAIALRRRLDTDWEDRFGNPRDALDHVPP